VFQPIVGPHAVSVYVNLTRACYGHARVSCSVRELSKATRLSATAVWRNLAVLESVGVLRVIKGRGSAGSSCELADLKDAAEALGATYDSRRTSYVLPEARLVELRAEVAARRLALQGKAVQRKNQPAGEPVCVSQRNANEGADFAASQVERNACVSQGNACVSLDGAAIEEKKEEPTNPIPYPFPREGVEEQTIAARRKAAAIDAVAWGRFRLALKQSLCGTIPFGKQKRMATIVAGIEDFDSCFRDWWLRSCEQLEASSVVVTDAAAPETTKQGLEKYRKRIEQLMVRHFGVVVKIQVVPR